MDGIGWIGWKSPGEVKHRAADAANKQVPAVRIVESAVTADSVCAIHCIVCKYRHCVRFAKVLQLGI